MAITIPCWNGEVWCFTKHGVFVLHDPANELQRPVAVILLGGDQRLVENHPHQFRCRRLLKVGYKMPR
jgi:hypothetical protein